MRKQVNKFVQLENKENYKLPKQLLSTPITPKIEKFGKSIRAKALPRYDTTTPLKQMPVKNNISSTRRNSAFFEQKKPFIGDISELSISFISHIDDSDKKSEIDQFSQSRFLRNKNVRFSEADQCEEISKSRSLKKSSILKNSRFSDKQSSASFNSHVGSICGGLTPKASVRDKGVLCQNSKYENTLKSLIHQNKKFFDDMFPPGGASLFYTKKDADKYKDIRWVRADQVFAGKKLTVYNQQGHNTVTAGNFKALDYMVSSFNALGTSLRSIEKIFENQKYSRYGIYYVRLNHGGIWKYVIVDDHIPVKKVGRSYIPVFLNIKPTKSNYYELWPFLLQKALAKLYSAYEALMGEEFQLCLSEITGLFPEAINLKNMEKDPSLFFTIRNYLINPDNILVARDPISEKYSSSKYFPISELPKSELNYFTAKDRVIILDSQQGNQELDLNQLSNHFSSLLIYNLDDSHYSVGCIIKQQKDSVSLRKFIVDGYGNVNISVIQKDRKHYRNNGYKYAWMRVILVLKDFDGYRWINGAYNNEKSLNLKCTLEPGEYFIIIMGEWEKKVFDVTLNYQGNLETQIIRQNINKYPDILQEACRDLSQRFGTFKQLSKHLCSYQCIDKKNGILIQNLNNQINREVYYQRKYTLPFKAFKSVGNVHLSPENQIQGFIDPDESLTLALMVIGGPPQQEMLEFEF